MNLESPLVLFDLEATSTDPENARIIQIAARRYPNEETFIRLVNPQMEVPQHILDLTGLEQLELDSAAHWKIVGKQFAEFMDGADLAGYNIHHYDFPLLQAEYNRHFGRKPPGPPERELIDAYLLEKQLRGRTLSEVYERRTNETLEDAHNAEVDVDATKAILDSQLDELLVEHDITNPSTRELAQFQRGDFLDPGGKLKEIDRGVQVCFGKYKGKTIEEINNQDPQYLDWMRREITELEPFIKEILSDAN